MGGRMCCFSSKPARDTRGGGEGGGVGGGGGGGRLWPKKKRGKIKQIKFGLASKRQWPPCAWPVVVVKVKRALRQVHRGATSLSHLCTRRMGLAGGRVAARTREPWRVAVSPVACSQFTLSAIKMRIASSCLPPYPFTKNKPYLSQSSSPFSFCSCCRNGLSSSGCFLSVATPGSQ